MNPNWDRDLESDIRSQLQQKHDELIDIATDKQTSDVLDTVLRMPEVQAWIKVMKEKEQTWTETLVKMEEYNPHRAGMIRGRIRALRSLTKAMPRSQEVLEAADQRMTGLRQEIKRLEDVLTRR